MHSATDEVASHDMLQVIRNAGAGEFWQNYKLDICTMIPNTSQMDVIRWLILEQNASK